MNVLREDCSPTFHSASTAALPQAAAVKVAMFVNREVKHVDSEPGGSRLGTPVDTYRDSPPPYEVSTAEPADTAVVTENHSPVVLPPASQPHRYEGTQLDQLEVSRSNMGPMSPDSGLREWLIKHPCLSFRTKMQVTRRAHSAMIPNIPGRSSSASPRRIL